MKKISSSATFYSKRIFPLIWFGFLAVFIVTGGVGGAWQQNIMFLIIPIGMAVFGYALMKTLVWDLVDEVYDCGDHLIVKKGNEEERVLLSNIMNVSATMASNPPRISLRLLQPGKFGSEIAFMPTIGFALNPLAKSPIAEDLIVRVECARSKRTV